MTQLNELPTPSPDGNEAVARPDIEGGQAKVDASFWGFLFTEMCVFATFYTVFMWYRGKQPDVFQAGHALLSPVSGFLNTIFMLLGSLCIVLATAALRRHEVARGRLFIVGAEVAAALFIVHKIFEWTALTSEGYTLNSSAFFQLFFGLTGIHLGHVVIAMIIGFFMWRAAGSVGPSPRGRRKLRFIVTGALYFHLVDLLWMGLFALFYLMKGRGLS